MNENIQMPETEEEWTALRQRVEKQLLVTFRCGCCKELHPLEEVGQDEKGYVVVIGDAGVICQECVDLYELLGGTLVYAQTTDEEEGKTPPEW